jgi:hypothetical protein
MLCISMRRRKRRIPACQSFTKEPAVLHLPHGASRTDVDCGMAHFHQYTVQNGPHWYQFANKHLGRKISNGSLILVTGYTMAHSWAITSYSDTSSAVEQELTFNLSSDGTYSWETDVVSTVHTSHGQPDQDGSTLSQNQCVFIRGMRVTIQHRIFMHALVKIS